MRGIFALLVNPAVRHVAYELYQACTGLIRQEIVCYSALACAGPVRLEFQPSMCGNAPVEVTAKHRLSDLRSIKCRVPLSEFYENTGLPAVKATSSKAPIRKKSKPQVG